MSRLIRRASKKQGMVPGTVVYVGETKVGKPKITIIDYHDEQFQEKEAETVEECYPFRETPTVSWLNIDGIHQTEIVEKLGNHFNLHPLLLEDVTNTGQRPKLEDYEDYVFIVLKMLHFDKKLDELQAEQVSLILGPNYVISFQETEGDVFDFVRERIRNSKGRIRKSGADYLAYAIIDAIVDSYFGILEKFGESLEALEDELVTNPTQKTLHRIYEIKREMVFLRKSIWPLREVISGMQRTESALVKDSTGVYLRDLYDHTIQVIDTVESFRDMVSGMLDTYLSSISNRMNEVMKVLTIIATVFIPLTFLAGIYGMNFDYLPELHWRWAYFGWWGVSVAIAGVMWMYFRRRGWI